MASVLRTLGTRCVFKAGQLTCVLKSAKETMAEKFNGVFQISD